MKLAEALIKRASYKRRIEILRDKLIKYAKRQEGEEPAVNPDDVMNYINECLSNCIL